MFNKNEKVYCTTPYSKMQLLCTVQEYQQHSNMVLVKLPCTIQGHKTALVQWKDIKRIQPKNQRPEPEATAPKSVKHNPFRELVELIGKQSDQNIKKQNDKASQQVQTQNDYSHLTKDEQSIIETLSPTERDAYMELLK